MQPLSILRFFKCSDLKKRFDKCLRMHTKITSGFFNVLNCILPIYLNYNHLIKQYMQPET